MPDTREIPQVLAQAEDIAASVGQPLTTAHLLLALFVTPCAAGNLLRERGVGDREVTAVLTRSPVEPAAQVAEVVQRAREIAAGVDAPTDSLHLLIAFGRQRGCLAHDLLVRAGLPLAALRNTVLSWYTGGRRPKGMEPVGGLAPEPVVARARQRELRDDEILPARKVGERGLGPGAGARRERAGGGGHVAAGRPATSTGEGAALPRGADRVAAGRFSTSTGEGATLPRGGDRVAAGRFPTSTGEGAALPRGADRVAAATSARSAEDGLTLPPGADRVAAAMLSTSAGEGLTLPRAANRVAAARFAGSAADETVFPHAAASIAAEMSSTSTGEGPTLPRGADRVAAARFAGSAEDEATFPHGAEGVAAAMSLTSAGEAQALPRGADRVAAAISPAPARGTPAYARGAHHVAAAMPRRRPSPAEVALDPALFPQLCAFGRNLTEAAAAGRLDPVIGRDREVDEIVDILGKRRGNNPVLVGEPGVGKTAVVEGVAQALLAAARPGEPLRIVVELEMGSLVAGTSLRGAFSERLGAIKEEVRSAGGRVVVFLDELHTVVGAGSTGDGPQDAANELKTALARGEFPCIGATTWDEYRKHIESDPALERRFTPVRVEEPTVAQTVEILRGLCPRYESHHGVAFEPAALEAAAALSARYIADRQLPDKAIGLLDLAGSRTRRAGGEVVGVREIAEVVSRIAVVPLDRLLLDDRERLLRLEADLGDRVVGHRETIGRIARAIRRNYAGFGARRPMGSFLFLGPTGVGKTELAKAIAHVLHGTEDALVRVDMSELGEAHTVARLIGAPPGYVGHGEGGQLTEAVRRRPSCVVLFDEIEKAHRDVLLLLLQVLDEGRLTDAHGRAIDFTQSIVVLTSNLGAEAFAARSAPRLGFGAAADEGAERGSRALEIARAALPPELWNRIDDRCLFEPLGRDEVAGIARLLLEESARRIAAERRITLAFDDAVIERLLERGGWDPLLGARPMRQAIQREVEAPLADAILRGVVADGGSVCARIDGDAIAFVAA